MSRIAAVDIGSNSVLLAVGDPLGQSDFRTIYDSVQTTRLGEGLDRSRRLTKAAIERTREALVACRRKVQILGVTLARAVATAAVREAHNAEEFLEVAKKALGFEVEVIDGRREAELTWRGVAASTEERPMMIIDLGGASTEIVLARDGRIERTVSMPLGAARMREAVPSEDPLRYFARVAGAVPANLRPEAQADRKVVVVGGTATTLAAMRQEIRHWDPELVEGQAFTVMELGALVERIRETEMEERLRLPGLPASRAGIITSGGLLLVQILEELGIRDFAVSCRGVRHGLLRELSEGRLG